MLKLIKSLHYGSFKSTSWPSSWFMSNHQITSSCFSTTYASQPKLDKVNQEKSEISTSSKKTSNPNHPMVNLVFDALNSNKKNEIAKATTVEDLLKTADSPNINDESICLIIRTFNQWVTQKKVIRSDYDKDPRFQNLLKKYVKITNSKSAAKLIKKEISSKLSDVTHEFTDTSKLTSSQCVKVMSGLAIKHTRMKPLLRTLTTCISNDVNSLTLKENANVLYYMAVLNFPHEPLLNKTSKKILQSLDTIEQSPIIGSIVTSLGILRYRNDELMNAISEWIVKNKEILRAQDLSAFLMTLATIGLKPVNSEIFFQKLIIPLKKTDMIKSSEWLDTVWALCVLNQVTPTHIESVLNEKFLDLLLDDDSKIPIVKKHKLQNINAVARLLVPNYSGPLLTSDSPVFDAPLLQSKEKQTFIRAITDALANLFPSRDFFQTNNNSNIGFVLDVEFYFDNKKGPLLSSVGLTSKNALRIGIVAHSFHDYCIGENQLIGPVLLHHRLLEAQGYRVIGISYENFRTDDKLLKRITYINDCIKSVVK